MEIYNYSILIHYSEIALKLKNRPYFERMFINNIKLHLEGLGFSNIKLKAARVIIHGINFKDWGKFKHCLKNVMGLQNATLMIKVKTDLKEIQKTSSHLIKNISFDKFRITTKRQYKQFQYTSGDINTIIGKHIQDQTKSSVNLNNPDCNIIIEIMKDISYIGYDKISGFSGLPANCQEKALSLISSGIDSPVASFEMIKRGVIVEFIHFHSLPAINKQSIENVKNILKVLSNYQLDSTLFLVPLFELQQKVMQIIPDKYWVIFFRKLMIELSNTIAEKNGAIALISGESVGQVASQTLSNIRAISKNSTLPILRPLCGMNKEDIVNKAKLIGTYDISIMQHDDCCSFFVPPHPETKARLNDISDMEEKLNLSESLSTAIEKTEKINIKYIGV